MTQRGGGSFTVTEFGTLMQIEQPTRDHPEGNRPRNADGKPVLSAVEGPIVDAPPPVLSAVEGPVLSNVEGPPERPRGGPRRLNTVKE